MSIKSLIAVFIMITTISCEESAKSPEGLIKMYVKDVTTKSLSRDYFEKYTTGKLLDSINSLSDDEFKKFVDLKKIKNAYADISTKNCSESKCTITYVVKYDVVKEEEKEFSSEVKKIASLVKYEEIWKIEEVSNVKTYIEAKKPIDAMSENN
jgi:predicted membrane-bound dolichyl-phosphate-mannose-protein mannosyltransferase